MCANKIHIILYNANNTLPPHMSVFVPQIYIKPIFPANRINSEAGRILFSHLTLAKNLLYIFLYFYMKFDNGNNKPKDL